MAGKSNLDADQGNVGSHFTEDGKIGGTAQKVGGPFDKDGTVGKEFTKDGTIGGAAQNSAEGKPLFDKDGAIGRQFKADGVIGQVGEKVGGPFSSDGGVGKHFNADGTIGGAVQDNLGSGKK
ncbi:MAG: hypothetical protein GOMPHAMPRED_006509 [Gomphillus americanus]|uniref:Uncharacterized protein n=1 Tax=Gomphillus americanus TaxID=1940652 RepID=A0A8H3ISW6_9LECA|nr:MAG: hypothetical protein GOMPHAMPRED_006509 [Gomphillus americanus]